MNVKYDFSGKTVLVAGGADGIGNATADLLGRSGANLMIADYNEARGLEATEEFKKKGYNAEFIRCDVRKKEETAAAVAKAVEVFGRIDYAANVCGISDHKEANFIPFHEWKDEWRDNVIDTNLKGHWNLLQSELKQMMEQGGEGYAIVEVSSIQAVQSSAGNGAYSTSKHAVSGMIKTVAAEYVQQGVRINGYAPTLVMTPMMEKLFGDKAKQDPASFCGNPRGTILTPEECAQSIVWLLSDGASSVNAHLLMGDCGQVGIRASRPTEKR